MTRLSRLSRSISGKVALVTERRAAWGARPRLFADEGARVAVVDVNASGVDAVVDGSARPAGKLAASPSTSASAGVSRGSSPTSSLTSAGSTS